MIPVGSLGDYEVDSMYIKCTIDVGLVFKKNTNGKKECTEYVDFNYAGNFDKRQSTTGYCLHIVPNTGELALDFTVYCRFFDNRS